MSKSLAAIAFAALLGLAACSEEPAVDNNAETDVADEAIANFDQDFSNAAIDQAAQSALNTAYTSAPVGRPADQSD